MEVSTLTKLTQHTQEQNMHMSAEAGQDLR